MMQPYTSRDPDLRARDAEIYKKYHADNPESTKAKRRKQAEGIKQAGLMKEAYEEHLKKIRGKKCSKSVETARKNGIVP